MNIVTLLYAQAAPAATASAPNPLSGFIPLILIFVIFYFLLILPQQKRDKEHKKLLNNLKRNDNVLTSSGIYGTVVNVQPDIVELKIDENTKIKITKSAVAQVITQSSLQPEAKSAELLK